MDKRNVQNRQRKQKLKAKQGHGHAKDPKRSFVNLEESSDDQFSKRSLSSNWSYYDEEEIGEENEQVHAPDFSDILLSERDSDKFVLDVGKNWENDPGIFENNASRKYFDLNVQLLNIGLNTIPFYKRLDYDKSLFSKHQIKKMIAVALKCEDDYQFALSKHATQPDLPESRINSANSKNDPTNKQNSTNAPIHAEHPPAPIADDKDEELDEILKLTTESVKDMNIGDANENASAPAEETVENPTETEVAPTSPEFKNKEDVQEWLNDILNE